MSGSGSGRSGSGSGSGSGVFAAKFLESFAFSFKSYSSGRLICTGGFERGEVERGKFILEVFKPWTGMNLKETFLRI